MYGRTTTRVQKVTYLIEELQVPHERVILPSPAPSFYLETFPLGLVPAIRDGFITLDGSNAICAYLAHKYNDRGFFPQKHVEVGRAFQWGDYIENYLATPRLNVVYHGMINKTYPPSFKRPGCPNDEEMDRHVDETVKALLLLDSYLSSSDKRTDNIECLYLIGNKFSFADAIAAPWIHRWFEYANTGEFGPRLMPKNFDSVMRYYDCLSSRPAFQRAILS